jgi:hypothetical protein
MLVNYGKNKTTELNDEYISEIDKSVLQYIPKKLHKNIVHIDKWKCEEIGESPNLYYYCIAFEFKGEPANIDGENGYTCYNCIGIEDIKWYCKQVLNGRRGCDW